MLQFMLRRLLVVVPMMFLISVASFAIIQAPRGDYVTAYVAKRYAAFEPVSPDEEEELRRLYGLDSSLVVQYVKWMGRLLRGDLGLSLSYEKPVSELLADRVLMTVALSGLTIVFVWTLAIPIGVISAVKQYSVIDYFLTFWSYLGIGTPNFLLALVVMWLVLDNLGWSVGGLFSPDYIEAPWSIGRVIDVLKHIWIPMLILGTDGTAGLTRIVRANLLDELNKPYVLTARSKGLPRWQVDFQLPSADSPQSLLQRRRIRPADTLLGCDDSRCGVGLAHRWSSPAGGRLERGYVPGRLAPLHTDRPHAGGHLSLRSGVWPGRTRAYA